MHCDTPKLIPDPFLSVNPGVKTSKLPPDAWRSACLYLNIPPLFCKNVIQIKTGWPWYEGFPYFLVFYLSQLISVRLLNFSFISIDHMLSSVTFCHHLRLFLKWFFCSVSSTADVFLDCRPLPIASPSVKSRQAVNVDLLGLFVHETSKEIF